MELHLKDKDFVNSIVPYSMSYCFIDACPKASKCFRRIAAKCKPASKHEGYAVYPDALQEGRCRYFLRPRIVNAAWGFKSLYAQVRQQDVTTLRFRMMDLLGSRTYYYRYYRGEKLLSPEQQQAIGKLFADYGYDMPQFDGFKEIIDFTDKEEPTGL